MKSRGREVKVALRGEASGAACSQLPPQIPDHELVRCIGRGSYGEVWLARTVLDDFRAVKVVYRENFEHDRPYEREFEGIQKFEPISRTHESQVDILHVGRNDQAGYFYYVMELADDANAGQGSSLPVHRASLPGEENAKLEASPPAGRMPSPQFEPSTYTPRTLKLDLYRRTRLPLEECIQIGLALTTALEHLHAHGLVHRDIKPSNIIFVNGTPKLADIGLVASMDATMSFVGTSGFLPPEGPGTPQGDIYSLGKVLYEMGMGRDRQEFPKLPANLAEFDDPARLLELNAVILKACARDPRQRYQSARDMGVDLALLQRGQSVKHKRAVERRWAIAKKLSLAAIALALLITALPFVKGLSHRKPANPEAVRLYELGRWHQSQLTDADLKKAIEYLNQAIQIDPTYVEPYAALFGIYTWDEITGLSEKENNQKVKEIAGKLLSLAPNRAEGHVALSYSKCTDGDWLHAEEEVQRALQLDPECANAHGFYCYYLSLLGRIKEALVHGNRAQELDPTSRIQATVAGYPFITARRYDDAITQFRKAVALDKNFPLAHRWIAKANEGKGDYLAAIAEYETLGRLIGAKEEPMARENGALRQAFAQSGTRGYWLKVLDFYQTEGSLVNPRATAPGSLQSHDYNLAMIYAQLGEKQKALDELDRLLGTEADASWLNFEPLYEPLRTEPRFQALLKKFGLKE